MTKRIQSALLALLATTMLLAVSAAAQSHTSNQFQGPKANKGTVTHSTRDGKSILTLSDDFVVPDTPDPHWQTGGFRRQYLPRRQTQEESSDRRQASERNCRARLREECVQGRHLLRMGRSQPGGSQLQFARKVNQPVAEGREPIRTWTARPLHQRVTPSLDLAKHGSKRENQ